MNKPTIRDLTYLEFCAVAFQLASLTNTTLPRLLDEIKLLREVLGNEILCDCKWVGGSLVNRCFAHRSIVESLERLP